MRCPFQDFVRFFPPLLTLFQCVNLALYLPGEFSSSVQRCVLHFITILLCTHCTSTTIWQYVEIDDGMAFSNFKLEQKELESNTAPCISGMFLYTSYWLLLPIVRAVGKVGDFRPSNTCECPVSSLGCEEQPILYYTCKRHVLMCQFF